jgi:hypothetical protein
VQAEGDEFGSPAEVRALLAGSAGPRRVTAVPGTTHLFGEDLPGLEREAREALRWLLAAAGLSQVPAEGDPLPDGGGVA